MIYYRQALGEKGKVMHTWNSERELNECSVQGGRSVRHLILIIIKQ